MYYVFLQIDYYFMVDWQRLVIEEVYGFDLLFVDLVVSMGLIFVFFLFYVDLLIYFVFFFDFGKLLQLII